MSVTATTPVILLRGFKTDDFRWLDQALPFQDTIDRAL